MLTLQSTPQEIQARIDELNWHPDPESLAEIEIIKSTVAEEIGVENFESESGGMLVNYAIFGILYSLDIDVVYGIEEMLYAIAVKRRQDVIDKLLTARAWTKPVKKFLWLAKELLSILEGR